MKNTFFFLLFISAIVALFAFAFSFSQSDEVDGQQIFTDSKCIKCHSVESLEITSKKDDALDLSNVGADSDAEFLKKYLVKEETMNDKKHKTKFKGSEEELNTLVDWLLTLKTEEVETEG
ncbi:MAG: cytochrome c [Ignavibacteria bacterium]|nr:cytochrome c [Ignavibacteria bacterium]MBT8383720.1 cytochrome c [Ignavibacteria bacterium]MBT8390697.1 cytochrome c [Ignavibacteria bacterium]NNJ53321.1 c-type cytochrome [Ignavibacteriaceae bacterium]NNL22259.1 c-type cytochrome [Ignavibacteriaceae bacterium]